MACNCKRAQSFVEKNGIQEQENLFTKSVRLFYRITFFLIAIAIAFVVIPILIFVAIYKICFGNNKITLPKFMRKYLE